MMQYITMGYELDPELRKKTKAILTTNSTLVGPRYGGSKLKRIIEDAFVLATSPLSLPAIGLAGLAVFIGDGKWPFVDIGNDFLGAHTPEWKIRTIHDRLGQM